MIHMQLLHILFIKKYFPANQILCGKRCGTQRLLSLKSIAGLPEYRKAVQVSVCVQRDDILTGSEIPFPNTPYGTVVHCKERRK